jgi:hypothetical protein
LLLFGCACKQVVEWLAGVAEDNRAFKATGFERFEQLLSGHQVKH